jgi:phospholipid-binding lipoprotein MlaA
MLGLAAWLLALPAGAAADAKLLDAGGTDPWEGFNRRIFWFNMQLDRFVLEPAGIAWDTVLPDVVQTSIRNVYDNLRFPVLVVNDALQLKPEAVAEDIGRFLINSIWGVGGLWDAAALAGLEANDEDFGQTLGTWGVPSGPYLVLPFFGASSPRDTLGLAVDAGIGYGAWFGVGIPIYLSVTITGADIVNRRSLLIDEIREEKAAAFDFYVFVRNAYTQNRARRVEDALETPEEVEAVEEAADDLYHPDEEGGDDLYHPDEEGEDDLYYPDEEDADE